MNADGDIHEQFNELLKTHGWGTAIEIVSEWVQEDKHRIMRPDVQRLCMRHASAISGYFNIWE